MQTGTPNPTGTHGSECRRGCRPRVGPLADVPAPASREDRFTAQPGDIAFVTVGSSEVVIHAADAGDTNEAE